MHMQQRQDSLLILKKKLQKSTFTKTQSENKKKLSQSLRHF